MKVRKLPPRTHIAIDFDVERRSELVEFNLLGDEEFDVYVTDDDEYESWLEGGSLAGEFSSERRRGHRFYVPLDRGSHKLVIVNRSKAKTVQVRKVMMTGR